MLSDRSKRKIANEHPKFADLAETFKKHKDEVVEKVKMADISQKDIDNTRLKGYSKVDLENAKMLSGNDSLTQKELDKLKKAIKDKATSKLETTGRFKKKD